MANFEAPSFSLGLEFDLDSQPQISVRNETEVGEEAWLSSSAPDFCLIEDENDFETPTVGRDPEPPRNLKRLRRGSDSAAQKRENVELGCNLDDEIEDFSSQEDRYGANEQSPVHYRSGCGGSKVSLRGQGVLTAQSTSQRKATKRKQTSDTLTSACLETSSKKSMLTKLTVSPLRRFQLLSDSDSDSPSVSKDSNKETNKIESSFKEKRSEPVQYPTTSGRNKTQDFWKDFYADKNFHISTPALDEVCDEYFRSLNDKAKVSTQRCDKSINDNESCYQNSILINNDQHNCKMGGPTPPSHRYFFHDDPRIQKLVHSHLPYFFPLSATNNRGTKHPASSNIDYMSQFRHEECSKQRAGKTNARTSSTRGQKHSKESIVENVSQGSGSWMDPKSSMATPKDAGKRRVHPAGQSDGGHWYTNPSGKRVYVTKSGQELTGQSAYRHYKKESGGGFKKSKKKTAAKKQGAAKKHAAKKR